MRAGYSSTSCGWGGIRCCGSIRAGRFRPGKRVHYQPLRELVPSPGHSGWERARRFRAHGRRLNCTLLARWDEGYKDPWLLLTDLAPSAGEACWYGLRAWIEPGFKITKRGGWQWQYTRIADPQRATRLWLAVAVATLWLLSVGGMAEDTLPVSTLLPLADGDGPPPRSRRATQLRVVSVFRQGWITILIALLNQRHPPRSRFVPEPWPQIVQSNTLRGPHELLLAAVKTLPLKGGLPSHLLCSIAFQHSGYAFVAHSHPSARSGPRDPGDDGTASQIPAHT